jgi:hypothetical protein
LIRGASPPRTPPTNSLAGAPPPRSVRSGSLATACSLLPGGFAPAGPRRAHSRGPRRPAPFARAHSRQFVRFCRGLRPRGPPTSSLAGAPPPRSRLRQRLQRGSPKRLWREGGRAPGSLARLVRFCPGGLCPRTSAHHARGSELSCEPGRATALCSS